MDTQKTRTSELHMRQIYIRCCTEFLAGMGINLVSSLCGKNARKMFGKWFWEPDFPKDAKIVDVRYNFQFDVYNIYIESKTYPDVKVPPELLIICHSTNIWKEKEKVSFT